LFVKLFVIHGIRHFDTALLLLTDYSESLLSSAVPDVSSTYVLCVRLADVVNTVECVACIVFYLVLRCSIILIYTEKLKFFTVLLCGICFFLIKLRVCVFLQVYSMM
jgi:hypothetical protein